MVVGESNSLYRTRWIKSTPYKETPYTKLEGNYCNDMGGEISLDLVMNS